jgi:serine/threonine protein kinase/Flp pilus assembly protein TadD
MNEEALFAAALEKSSPEERGAFLADACGGDAELRSRVEGLLQAHDNPDSFLDRPHQRLVATVDEDPANKRTGADEPSAAEHPGTWIGPYKLLDEIGEGGMGSVWMAQQQEPVKRLVALKLVKAGMDSKQVLARFEAERQALALMDHPNIARVFDAGTTGNEPEALATGTAANFPVANASGSSGRPYFVMELVKGIPITKYCDEHRLTPRQRLELFVPVCQAIQHAHQKGIIHRDVKPSNVLVASYDGKPVPKVIDFGIAKAAGQPLTEKTLVTGFGMIVGTLEYMSPEQAMLNALDIDTRSDVYSLGVLLYELLTGTTPFETKRLQKAAFDEILRIIRKEEPPRPSTRLSTTDEAPSVAANRGMEPKKLSALVRGELDWIVMKALEKDRNRRYESANGFAMDIQRYLADEPVQACPPSASYRLGKFVRRKKTALTIAALVLFFVVLSSAGGVWIALDRAARRAKASHDLDLALRGSELYLDQAKRSAARAALDQAERLARDVSSPDQDERLTALRQRLEAAEQDDRFIAGFEDIRLRVETRVDVVRSRFNREAGWPALRDLFGQYGIQFADTPLEQAADRIRNRPESVCHQLVAALYHCAFRTPKEDTRAPEWFRALLELVDTDPWRRKIRKAVVARDWKTIEQLVRAVDVNTQPAGFLIQFAEILPAARKAARLELLRKIQRAYPADVWANHNLAWELEVRGRHGEAIRYYTAALCLRPDSPGLYANRGRCLHVMKELDEAIADYRRCLVLAPNWFEAYGGQCDALQKQGRQKDALAVCNEGVQAIPTHAGVWTLRAGVHNKLSEHAKAIADSNQAIELDEKLAAAWADRGEAYRAIGKYDKAIADCNRALELDENSAFALATRGNSYLWRGEYQKAFVDCSRSIELDPTNAFAWYSRGIAYHFLGDNDKALADCRKAVELAPNDPWAHGNLGDALLNVNRSREASAAYRKAIEIDGNSPEFHAGLSLALRHQGEFHKALAEVRRARELPGKQPDWAAQTTEWLRQCERLVELDERLPALLAGKAKPAGPEERIELAELCVQKQLTRAAARFYDEAFTPVSPRTAPLIGAHRYNAACAAVLAGCGRGRDADKLGDEERSRLRRQGLDWLRGHLESAGHLLDSAPEKTPGVVGALKHSLTDPDLADVRHPQALAKLPEAERRAWQKLWSDVAGTLGRAEEKKSGKKSVEK